MPDRFVIGQLAGFKDGRAVVAQYPAARRSRTDAVVHAAEEFLLAGESGDRAEVERALAELKRAVKELG